ncbi:hypothetical protein LEP1GSC074_1730 [Leptospira noguchii str. Hook]|nr:hypothetical protein LEP1GSC074_1730 [Leptospira noguchii str. Hook]
MKDLNFYTILISKISCCPRDHKSETFGFPLFNLYRTG